MGQEEQLVKRLQRSGMALWTLSAEAAGEAAYQACNDMEAETRGHGGEVEDLIANGLELIISDLQAFKRTLERKAERAKKDAGVDEE